MVHVERLGMLATLSTRQAGFPFASLTPFGSDAAGQPTFLISRLAVHTQNLERNSRASLLVARAGSVEQALRAPRLSLVGHVTRVIDDGSVRHDYIERHPEAEQWIGYSDFGFYRMQVVEAYHVAGFGEMGWISADDYRRAQPDPLAEHRATIVEHMNRDHAQDLVLYCQAFGDIDAESAVLEEVDRLGICLRARLHGGEEHDLRIAFAREARTPQEARAVLVQMSREARRKLGVERP